MMFSTGSSQVMERLEDDGFRTVESLRGRLLAEREASKAAKEEADLMSQRLMELERLLTMEIKCRNKAERKLRCVLKKLESLKLVDDIPNLSVSSDEIFSGSVEISTFSCSSGSVLQGEMKRYQHSVNQKQKSDGEKKKEEGLSNLSTYLAQQSISENESWSSVGTAHSINKCNATCEESLESKDSSSLRGFNADTNRLPLSPISHDEYAHLDDYAHDDSLALVPATMWPDAGNDKPTNFQMTDAENAQPGNTDGPQMGDNVHDVLVALRRAKEQLHSSVCLSVNLLTQ